MLAFGLSTVGVQWPVLSLPASHEGQVFDPGFPMAVSSPMRCGRSCDEDQVPAEAAPEPAAAGDSTEQGAAPAGRAAAPQAPAVPEPTSFDTSGPRSPWGRDPGVRPGGTVRSGNYPTELTTASDPARISLMDGTGLAPIGGARVLYSVAPDRSAWSVTIIGARFGATASYSSAVGTVQAG